MGLVGSGGFCVLCGVVGGSTQLFIFFRFGVSVHLLALQKYEITHNFRQATSFSFHCSYHSSLLVPQQSVP